MLDKFCRRLKRKRCEVIRDASVVNSPLIFEQLRHKAMSFAEAGIESGEEAKRADQS
jgi:hypothetical protein